MNDTQAQAPSVSVVIPAYNHERFIEACLESVLAQDYPRLQVVVVNDGSKDRTGEIAERILGPLADAAGHRVFHQENQGIPRTLNRGVRASSGDLIAIIASDDYMLPTRIPKQAAFLADNPDVALVHSHVMRVDAEGRDLGSLRGTYVPAEGDVYRHFLMGTRGVCAPSIMFRRRAFDAVGGFAEELKVEDWPFFLRLAQAGYRFGFVDEELTCWRGLSTSAGRKTNLDWRASWRECQRHIAELPDDFAGEVRQNITYRYFRDAMYQRNYADLPEIVPLMLRSTMNVRTRTGQVVGVVAQHLAQRFVPDPIYARLRDLRYAVRPVSRQRS